MESNTFMRKRVVVGAIVVGLIAVAFGAWWFLFRDNSAASVNSAEAAEARQAVLDEAAANNAGGDGGDGAAAAAPDDYEAAPADEPAAEPAGEVAQPDAGAGAGSDFDGSWNVDTTIGSFDDACLTEVCSSSFVGFRINEELASIGAKTVVGRTPGVTGSIDITGSQITSGTFVVDMSQLLTDSNARTQALKGSSGGLETNTFPEAIFVLSQPVELGEIPVEGSSVSVQAVGDLTVHGVTRSVTIPLTAEHQAGVIVVFGELTDMLLTDYNIPVPTAAVVVSVEDKATMELQLFFTR